MPNVLSTISGILCSCATFVSSQYRHKYEDRQITYLGYLTDWTDIILWVPDALHEYGLGILIDSCS